MVLKTGNIVYQGDSETAEAKASLEEVLGAREKMEEHTADISTEKKDSNSETIPAGDVVSDIAKLREERIKRDQETSAEDVEVSITESEKKEVAIEDGENSDDETTGPVGCCKLKSYLVRSICSRVA